MGEAAAVLEVGGLVMLIRLYSDVDDDSARDSWDGGRDGRPRPRDALIATMYVWASWTR